MPEEKVAGVHLTPQPGGGRETCEGHSHGTILADEPAEKVGKPQEVLELFAVEWDWPIGNCLYLFGVRSHFHPSYHDTQESNGLSVKPALLRFNKACSLVVSEGPAEHVADAWRGSWKK